MALITTPVPRGAAELLREVSQGRATVREISRRLGRDRSTVRKQVRRLLDLGLLRVEKRKPIVVELTDLGRLLLAAGPGGRTGLPRAPD